MEESPQTPDPATGLSEQTAEFLIELARAVQRFGMYPEGHPARAETAGLLKDRLAAILQSRDGLPLRIAPDRLTVDGQETDPGNTVLANLSRRLYQHQLLTLTFRAGTEESEISELLNTISAQAGRQATPLGSGEPEELSRWAHIGLEPIPFESLTMSTGPLEERATEDRPAEVPPPAAAVAEEVPEEAVPVAVPEVEEVESGPEERPEPEVGDTEESLQQRISRFILKLDPDTLKDLVQRVDEVKPPDGSEDYVAEAVQELLQAAESGTLAEPSAALIKLMTKMGIHGGAEPAAAPAPDGAAVGKMVRKLGGDWNVQDPSPTDYKEALVGLSQRAPVLEDLPEWIQGPEPERLIQIGLELGEVGATVEKAVGEMIEEQRVSDLLGVLETATAEPETLDKVWDLVAIPQTVLQLLRAEPPGFDALDRLMPRLDLESAEVMIEVLSEVESASRCEEIIARIARLGPGVRPTAVARLDDERWHVRRNMLALLSQFDDLPEDFSLAPCLVDPDARVRREAMRLGLKTWTEIEAIIVAALEDDDPQIVELGVEAARRECPAEVVPFLVTMALDLKAAPVNRVGSIRALAASGSDRALPTLLKITWPRKLFWLRGLGVNSSEMLASLAELAARWPEDPHAARVLKAAARSKDAQIRAVARPKKAEE